MKIATMKTAAIICLTFIAFPVASRADGNSFAQPGIGAQGPASLVGGTAKLSGGILTVTVSTESASTEWNHVFLGTDGKTESGYVHTSGKKGGEGMDYMIEGTFLYRWSGLGDRHEWKWDKVEPAPITRTAGPNSFSVSVPLEALHLQAGAKLQIFIVTSTANYQVPLDTLPRNDALWQVEVPAAALDKTQGKAPPAVSPPSADARGRFKKITNYACYYGKGLVEQLARHDAVIIETRSQTAESIAAIKKKAPWSLAILVPEKIRS
jgi:hypothetical protein